MPGYSEVTVSRRDPRLDFFRGIAMFIILIAHTPGNEWINWIPARFGFSDATEIFVFCSGMASAIAFGGVFEQRGLMMGTARILHRVWQVYWAQLCLFLSVTGLLLGFDKLFATGGTYAATLNLPAFFGHVQAGILGLLTLTYVPNYFDILPMYCAILLMVPLAIVLRRLHPIAPFVASISLWAAAARGWLELPAEPWGDRGWFFNPFSWQLVFFTGFAFMRGWLPTPPIRRDWMIAAGGLVLAAVPFAWLVLLDAVPLLARGASAIGPLTDKTHFGLLRYGHFLALAYLAFATVTLLGWRFSGIIIDICRKVGQQSLGVFLASLLLAQISGMAMGRLDYSWAAVTLANLTGFAALVVVAHIIGWFKSMPWKRPAGVVPETVAARRTTSASGDFLHEVTGCAGAH